MISGADEHLCTVTFFKASGKYYAGGTVRLPDHWEIGGGDADQLLDYIAQRNPAVNPASVRSREFHMVLQPSPSVEADPAVRFLIPRMIPARGDR